MIRSIAIVSILIAGCAATKPEPAKTASSDAARREGVNYDLQHQCKDGDSSDAYGCRAGTDCPNMMNDVREKKGYHTLGTVRGGGKKFVHVADSCEHFFCGIDDECVKAGGTDYSCMRPTGCQVVQKL